MYTLHIYTDKTDSNRTYRTTQGMLLNILKQPIWEKNLERVDTCICIIESLALCCMPETNTTL